MATPEDDQPAGGLSHASKSRAASGVRGEPRGISWASMLVWIGIAFLVAGFLAYRLVTPFFIHH